MESPPGYLGRFRISTCSNHYLFFLGLPFGVVAALAGAHTDIWLTVGVGGGGAGLALIPVRAATRIGDITTPAC